MQYLEAAEETPSLAPDISGALKAPPQDENGLTSMGEPDRRTVKFAPQNEEISSKSNSIIAGQSDFRGYHQRNSINSRQRGFTSVKNILQ